VSVLGVNSRSLWRVIYLGILLVISFALSSCGSPASAAPEATSGPPSADGSIVINLLNDTPTKSLLKVATVRVISPQDGYKINEVDDADNDKLAIHPCTSNQFIAVWVPGYYVYSVSCDVSRKDYPVTLSPVATNNAPGYAWIGAEIGGQNCAGCHSASSGRTELDEWKADGHSRVFVDPFFWTMYMGIDIYGRSNGSADWKILDNGQRVRLAPPSGVDYYGPGYKLDYPNNFGNCGYCHMPAAVNASEQEIDLTTQGNNLSGRPINVETEGITCDICHKVTDVILSDNGLPFPNRPGVLSFSLLLPNAGQTHYIGPLAYRSPESNINVTCSPVFSESRFCASCHYGKFSDVEIYGSYREWLNSPYSQPGQNFRSCQDCHMPSYQPLVGNRGACSPENRDFRNFSHNMMNRDNTGNPIMVQQAATVDIDAKKEGGKINVIVTVVNRRAGHKFPTDSPLRHLILVVEAKDENGTILTQVAGPTIPAWGGTRDQPSVVDYAGRPGVIYANILKDKDTNMVPSVSYWNPTVPAWAGSDTRLLPNQSTPSAYSFVAPSHGEVRITVNLWYRYAFIDIIRQKEWPLQDKDILVNWAEVTVP
jgi:hypothetical protein